jgi:hypothetical protein
MDDIVAGCFVAEGGPSKKARPCEGWGKIYNCCVNIKNDSRINWPSIRPIVWSSPFD